MKTKDIQRFILNMIKTEILIIRNYYIELKLQLKIFNY